MSTQAVHILEVALRPTDPYGRVQPINELALRFAKLLRQTTLTRTNIQDIKALGYEVRTRAAESETL